MIPAERNLKLTVVSVITPSYQQGEFLEATIQSVVQQEGSFYLEYLVIDGGSTDNSVQIIKRYDFLLRSGLLPVKCAGVKFIWVSERDRGQANALNKGLVRSTGTIIGWVNSDDILLPGAIQKVVEAFYLFPDVDVFYGDVWVLDKNGAFFFRRKGRPRLLLRHFLQDNQLVQPEVFFRRRVVENIGFFDECFHYSMDYEFWVRALCKNTRFRYIPFSLAGFRVRDDAKSSGRYAGRFVESLFIQHRYFGSKSCLPKNIGEYAAEYSEKSGLGLMEALKSICDGLLIRVPAAERYFLSKQMSKGENYAHLKKAIYLSLKNRSLAFREVKAVIVKSPWLLLTVRGLVLWLHLLLGKRIYFSVRRLLSKAIGGGDVL